MDDSTQTGRTRQQIMEYRARLFNSMTPYIDPAKRRFWHTRLGRILFPIWRLFGGGPRRAGVVMHKQ